MLLVDVEVVVLEVRLVVEVLLASFGSLVHIVKDLSWVLLNLFGSVHLLDGVVEVRVALWESFFKVLLVK